MKIKIAVAVVAFVLCLVMLYPRLEVKAQGSAPPCLESEVSVDTGNGYGSTGVYGRRFQNVDVNVGSDITYADSATNGATFTVNTNGIYAMSYTDWRSDAGDGAGITINSSPATALGSISPAYVLCQFSPNSTNQHSCSVTMILAAGDVIRAHWGLLGNTTTYSSRFIMVKVR